MIRILLLLVLVAGCSRTIALVGDSTTYGTPKGGAQSPLNPAASLEALLGRDTGQWSGAKVVNYGVPGSNTTHWIQEPPAACAVLASFFVVGAACSQGTSWIKLVAKQKPDLVVVELGLNDYLITRDPEETVERLEQIRSELAPVPVVFFPPIAPSDGSRGDWPLGVRMAMEEQGLFAGEYPEAVPTYDRLHPTDGGYAAKAGLWIDSIRRVP